MKSFINAEGVNGLELDAQELEGVTGGVAANVANAEGNRPLWSVAGPGVKDYCPEKRSAALTIFNLDR